MNPSRGLEVNCKGSRSLSWQIREIYPEFMKVYYQSSAFLAEVQVLMTQSKSIKHNKSRPLNKCAMNITAKAQIALKAILSRISISKIQSPK